MIDITELKNNKKTSIDFNEDVVILKDQIDNKNIINLKDIHISGSINKYEIDTYEIDSYLNGVMVIPDSVTLEPVDFEFEADIIGDLDELFSEIGQTFKKSENSIDIFPIIWENILMEIPIRYSLNKNNLNSGDGWRIISDEDTPKYNPELKKLEELIEKSEVS